MRRKGWLYGALVIWLMAGGAAEAKRRHEDWRAVEKLAPGVSVVVEQMQGVPEKCLLVDVDDAKLTCDRNPDPNVNWGPGANARVVFPRDAVHSVWVWEPAANRHVELWIAGALGFALGGAICAPGGPGLIVECGFVGGLVVAGLVLSAESAPRYPWWFPPANYPQPPPKRMHRKLVYQAPQPATN